MNSHVRSGDRGRDSHRLSRLAVGIVVTIHPDMTGMIIVTEEADGGAT